jgi:hypothetical protein
MLGGITPIDNAFDLIGIHQCAALMKYLFIETPAGKIIFAAGFLLSLVKSLGGDGFKAVLVYIAAFFSCVLLMVLPAQSVTARVSTMEATGYEGVKTDAIIRKAGIDALRVNPVLLVMDQGVSLLVNGAVDVIDALPAHQARFLKDPFVTAKVSLLLRERFRSGIEDPVLKEGLVHFYQDHFLPALRQWREGAADDKGMPWPGDERVRDYYSPAGVEQWDALKSRLYDWVNRDKLLDYVSARFYADGVLKDPSVKALIEGDLRRSPRSYDALSGVSVSERFWPAEVSDGGDLDQALDRLCRIILTGYPVAQGMALWALWIALPLVMVAALFRSGVGLVLCFFRWLIIVKGVPLFLALTDRVSMLVVDIHQISGNGKLFLWEMPMIGVVVIGGSLASVLIGGRLMFWRGTSGGGE